MKNCKSSILQATFIIAAIIGTSSCMNNKPEDTKKVAEEKNEQKFDNNNEKNAQFLVDAADINREEISLGQLAQQKESAYLVLNGEAEIILDKTIIEELWTPVAKIWFKKGKDDPNITIIKVTPTTAYYWDNDGNRMINFLKMVTSVVTGTNLITDEKGAITV